MDEAGADLLRRLWVRSSRSWNVTRRVLRHRSLWDDLASLNASQAHQSLNAFMDEPVAWDGQLRADAAYLCGVQSLAGLCQPCRWLLEMEVSNAASVGRHMSWVLSPSELLKSGHYKEQGTEMGLPFIVISDQPDHGGVAVGASMTTDTYGKQVPRVGDQVTCPKRGHGATVIVSGNSTMIVEGKPAACHGYKTTCVLRLLPQFVSGLGQSCIS